MKNSMFPEDIELIVFDADDTLWDCQSHFEDVQRRYYEMLSQYDDAATVASGLFDTERANMELLGYGTKAFTLSLVENAVRVSGGRVSGDVVGEIVRMGKSLLSMSAEPLDGVRDTLERLSSYRMAMFTKGELLEQEGKLRRSGLAGFFEHVEIVSCKTEREHAALCERMGVVPEHVLMVGNSFRSDIAPAVTVGAWAAYIPFHVTWQLEHAEEYDHERIIKLSHIAELPAMLPGARR